MAAGCGASAWAQPEPGAWAGLPWWLLLAWLAFGAACAAAGALWVARRRDAELQQVRSEQRAWRQLSQQVAWRSDAQHRLVEWQAPAGGAPAPAPLAPGQALAEAFTPLITDGSAPAWPDCLKAEAAWSPLKLVSRSDQRLWLLSAQPCFDHRGRFCGHVGRARLIEPGEQARRDQALLQRLWPQLGEPALVLDDHGAAGWWLRQLTPEAARLWPGAAAVEAGQPWAPLCQQLPADLATAVNRLEPGGSLDCGEWTLRLLVLDGADGERPARLLWLRPARAQAASPASDEKDQESFIYSISHDLRAPIRVVEGFSRILKEDYGRFLDRIGNDHVDRVLAAAARMHSMIDALLALSRLQSQPLSRKPVDLSQLATYVMEDLRREQPERAADIRIEPGLVVQGDPTLLRIALENLLGNAWKYSGQCSVTHIELRREQLDGRPVYVVADQGAGFDMRFADRLFGVFQRLHSAKDFQGTGVGLASVRRIVRRHGGDIWAESEVGQGARFHFTLAP